MKHEIQSLKNLNNKYIIQILDAKIDVNFIDIDGEQQIGDYIAFEYMENGDLFDLL